MRALTTEEMDVLLGEHNIWSWSSKRLHRVAVRLVRLGLFKSVGGEMTKKGGQAYLELCALRNTKFAVGQLQSAVKLLKEARC